MCLSGIPQHNTINDIHMNNIHSTVQSDMYVSVHKMDCDDYNDYKCYIYNFTSSLSKYCNTLLLYTEN